MNPEQRRVSIEEAQSEAQFEAVLRNFRLSAHAWSNEEFVRPRAIERTRWADFQARFWRALANPALGGTLAALLLMTSVGIPVNIHRQHVLEAEHQAVANLAKKHAEALARKAEVAAVASASDDGAFLDDVDSDIAQATPDAMQPLASLMNDAPSKSSRR
jgi:hypothetical protein